MAIPNRFDGFTFEQYQFREFPKYVVHGGKDYFVNNAAEEAAILATDVNYEAKDWELLKKKAIKLNVKFSNEWSVDKLAARVKKAEADLEYAAQFADEIADDEAEEFVSTLKEPSESNKLLNAEDSKKKQLLAKAEEMGLFVDKRWGVDKIESVINKK